MGYGEPEHKEWGILICVLTSKGSHYSIEPKTKQMTCQLCKYYAYQYIKLATKIYIAKGVSERRQRKITLL